MIAVYLGIAGFALLLLLVVALLRPASAFTIELHDGTVARTTGQVPEEFIKDVQRICTLWNVREGRITGVRDGSGVRIKVAGPIPPEHARAFQNAWNHPL